MEKVRMQLTMLPHMIFDTQFGGEIGWGCSQLLVSMTPPRVAFFGKHDQRYRVSLTYVSTGLRRDPSTVRDIHFYTANQDNAPRQHTTTVSCIQQYTVQHDTIVIK